MSDSAPKLLEIILRRRWASVIERVTSHPAEGKYININGWGAVHIACYFPDTPAEAVHALLEANPDAVSIQDNQGLTPLHYACANSSACAVRRLLEENLDMMEVRDVQMRTPLEYMCHKHLSPMRSPSVADDGSSTLVEPDFSNLPHKPIWSKVHLLLKAAYHGSIDDDATTLLSNDEWRIMHACAGVSYCPPKLCKMLVSRYSSQLEDVDQHGNTPLHVAASIPPSPQGRVYDNNEEGNTSESEPETTVINVLTAACPGAARTPNTDGKLPLHLAIESGKNWEFGVSSILNAYPAALTSKDQITGLFPFMTAATVDGVSLGTVFHLLRCCPELERFKGGGTRVGREDGVCEDATVQGNDDVNGGKEMIGASELDAGDHLSKRAKVV